MDWAAIKEADRLKRREEKDARRRDMVARMTPEELVEYDRVHEEFRAQKVAENVQKKAIARQRLQEARPLIIDCNFDDLMTDAELRSLRQQILYCYGLAAKSEHPLRLQFLNYKDDKLQLSKISGCANWQVDYIEEMPPNAVYLTADSPNMLTEYDPNAVYVIGGLVDRNRHKNATLERAAALGIKTACIPLKQHVRLQTSQVITVNQIFELMTYLHGGDSVEAACRRAVPERKTVQ